MTIARNDVLADKLSSFVRGQQGDADRDIFVVVACVGNETIDVRGMTNLGDNVPLETFVRAWVALSGELDKAFRQVAQHVARQANKPVAEVLQEFLALRDSALKAKNQ